MLRKKLKFALMLLLILPIAALSGAAGLLRPITPIEQAKEQLNKDHKSSTKVKKQKDQDLIQGIWKVTKIEFNGKVNTKNFREGIWAFKGKKVQLRNARGKEWYNGTFVLDPEKKPKEIDITWVDGPLKGRTQKGIYKIEKNIITLSRGTDKRPKEFTDAGKVGKPGLIALELMKSE